jgi:hypothetical protein
MWLKGHKKEAENVFGSEEYDCGVDLFIGEEKRDFEKKKGGGCWVQSFPIGDT